MGTRTPFVVLMALLVATSSAAAANRRYIVTFSSPPSASAAGKGPSHAARRAAAAAAPKRQQAAFHAAAADAALKYETHFSFHTLLNAVSLSFQIGVDEASALAVVKVGRKCFVGPRADLDALFLQAIRCGIVRP
jgi:hypothetical protein